MPTSAVGNKLLTARPQGRKAGRRPQGFTLIELMVVLVLMAVAMGGAQLALRDSADGALERDARRLAAMLEAARMRARANDVPVLADVSDQGVRIRGAEVASEPETGLGSEWRPWLSEATRAAVVGAVVLGPEPLLPPRRIELRSQAVADLSIWVSTDGLRPWGVQRSLLDNPAASAP